MKKIKLLHVSQPSGGGVEIYIRQIIHLIDYNRFELSVITPQNESFEHFCKEHHVACYRVDMVRGISIFGDIQSFCNICRLIKKINPDIVHLHSSKAGFIGRIATKLLHKKSIFTPHGVSYMMFTGRKRMLFKILEIFARIFTYRVLGCSNSESKRMNIDLKIPVSKINTLPNAISIENINSKNEKTADTIKIGTIGRLTYQKNPLLLVNIANQTLKKYPNAEFSILGAGQNDTLREETVCLISKFEIADKFKILPYKTKAEAENYLKSLDIFILPSIFEGLPLSLLEAMACGVPCITSKCDGCNDVIVNNINGFSCMLAEEYVDAISVLMENSQLRLQIIQNAYSYVSKKHNINEFIKQLSIYYEKICAEPFSTTNMKS
jgi:glycosyltransferase involved in cell wall biosynthesis